MEERSWILEIIEDTKKYIKEEVKYDPPNTIKKKILELEENISKTLRELEF